jgi:hypothetical protein
VEKPAVTFRLFSNEKREPNQDPNERLAKRKKLIISFQRIEDCT